MAANTSEFQEELQKLERKHADNPDGRYFVPLATAYRKAGETDRAIELLRQGLENNREYLSAHIVLGRCLADKGEDAAARQEFDFVLQLDPQNLVALRSLGEIALAGGDYADARKHYEQLLAVDPMNEDARRALEKLDSAPPAPEPARPAAPTPPRVASEPVQTPSSAAPSAPPSWPEADDDFEVPRREAAVVTETIAELYTRQGFYDRAVEVYQELIRRRGPEPELQERLARVQRLLSGTSDRQDDAAASPAPTPASTPTVSVDPPARSAPQPDEAPSPIETDQAEQTFADDPNSDENLIMAGYSASSFVEGEPASTQTSPEESIGDFLVSVLSWTPGSPGRGQQAAPTDPGVSAETDVGFVEGFDSDRLGWQETESATDSWDAPRTADSSETPFGDDDLGLEPPLAEQAEEQAPAPTRPAPSPQPENRTGDDSEHELAEDDLESFQEWLRSLKR